MNKEILDEASRWFVDFRAGDLTSRAQEDFSKWLRSSPEHIRAYLDIAETYAITSCLKGKTTFDLNQLVAAARAERKIYPLGTTGRYVTPLAKLIARQRSGGHLPQLGLLAAFAVLAISGAIGTWYAKSRASVYATDIGEQLSVPLQDGSFVQLNSRSSVSVLYTKSERRIALLRGEALFRVAPDTNRTFTVNTGKALVRAIGTEFDIYQNRKGTTVTVIKGRAAVTTRVKSSQSLKSSIAEDDVGSTMMSESNTPSTNRNHLQPLRSRAAANPEDLRDVHGENETHVATRPDSPTGNYEIVLNAGEQLTISPSIFSTPKRVDIGSVTAWTQHQLIFNRSSLPEVAAEFNRYNRKQMIVEGSELDAFNISGLYTSTDPTSLISFLKTQPGILIREDSLTIRISTNR